MNCPSKQTLLEFLNGEMPTLESPVPTHVESCLSCKKEYDSLNRVTELLVTQKPEIQADSCPSEEEIVGYLRGSLSEEAYNKIEAHVSSCNDCLDEVVALSEALEEVPEGFPQELGHRVMAVGQRMNPSRRTRSSLSSRRRRAIVASQKRKQSPLPYILAAASVLIAVTVLVMVSQVDEPKPGDNIVKPDVPKGEVIVKDIPPVKPEPKPEPREDVVKNDPKPEPKDDVVKKDPEPDTPETPVEVPKDDIVQKDPDPRETVVEKKFVAVGIQSVTGLLYLKSGKTISGMLSLGRDDEILTRHRSPAKIATADGDIYLKNDSSLKIEKTSTGDVRVTLTNGEAYFAISKKARKFVVGTEAADAIVTGTSFLLNKQRAKTTLTVIEGSVKFKNNKGEVDVVANRQSVATKSSRPSRPKRGDASSLITWTERSDFTGHPVPFIEAQPGKNRHHAGVVIVAPYSTHESNTGIMARAVAVPDDLPLVIGHRYRKNVASEEWPNIDRGTIGSGGTGTEATREAYRRYRMALGEATGFPMKRPVEMIVNFRSHSETTGDQTIWVCEVSTHGISEKTLKAARQKLPGIIAKHEPKQIVEFRFDLLDGTYDYMGSHRTFKYTEGDAKATGYMTKEVSRKALCFFFPILSGDDSEAYAGIAWDLSQLLKTHK